MVGEKAPDGVVSPAGLSLLQLLGCIRLKIKMERLSHMPDKGIMQDTGCLLCAKSRNKQVSTFSNLLGLYFFFLNSGLLVTIENRILLNELKMFF